MKYEMEYENEATIVISAKSQNEAFARVAVAAFVAQLDPTVEELTDVKTAVSEAVTNAIIHGYENSPGKITIDCKIKDHIVFVEVKDEGAGIENIAEAMAPLFTTKPELERSGMGFTVMETFMDEITVDSQKNKGTRVCMQKTFARE